MTRRRKARKPAEPPAPFVPCTVCCAPLARVGARHICGATPAIVALELGALRDLEAYVRAAEHQRMTAADITQIRAILEGIDAIRAALVKYDQTPPNTPTSEPLR